MMFSLSCLAALVPTALAATLVQRAPTAHSPIVRAQRAPAKTKEFVQDGITLAAHGDEAFVEKNSPFEVDTDVPALIEGKTRICEDAASEHTGFDVHGGDGFMKHASCEDLKNFCQNGTMGEQVRKSCPVSCFICLPKGDTSQSGPCFDATNTGIRFRDGPKAKCPDLINYCNHSSIGQQVTQACKLSCGGCELHIEGPYLDTYGNCVDLETHKEPQFTIAGAVAGCSDMSQFCQNHPDSYLIRHKCPLTCRVCGNEDQSATASKTPESTEVNIPGDAGGCSRRLRWGFCSSRRRRNV